MIKGKVVLIPFPFDDLSATKLRPAVCLTDSIGPFQHLVLAFITSRMPSDLGKTDLILDSTAPDFKETGLKVTSVVRLHRLITVSASLIVRELGSLSSDQQTEVANRLRYLFAL
ncbi:MAG TPA: type II toxin-antitoxin system PemK/MazF family toxin [Rhodothermales bacterium]|nr:type II toxin-antitoxin system PemK/MazF family toxin [Rhodothermales bacterium]